MNKYLIKYDVALDEFKLYFLILYKWINVKVFQSAFRKWWHINMYYLLRNTNMYIYCYCDGISMIRSVICPVKINQNSGIERECIPVGTFRQLFTWLHIMICYLQFDGVFTLISYRRFDISAALHFSIVSIKEALYNY